MRDRAESYYDILEVSYDVSQIELKRSYYRLAKKYHPDRSPLNRTLYRERLYEINEAYEQLKTLERRAKYNEFLVKVGKLKPKALNDNVLNNVMNAFRNFKKN